MVTFVRSGGLAGVEERLVIGRDGQGMLTTRSQPKPSLFAIGSDDLAHLRSLLENARLSSLRRQYPPRGADMFQYDVAYSGQSVTAYDTSIPPPLQPAIDFLVQITRKHGGL